MEYSPIADLRPELPALDSKQFRAVVTLIWPYSSSARQFALLLAEPNIRLRRKNGQVRARFFGSSARAMASTGVGIGDEVVLSLRGASFVREDTVSTPGKSIDYELEYTQTVSVQITRNGIEHATLDIADVAPTPANRSPVRPTPHKPTLPMIGEPAQWTSPAFLKRTRLSEGPVFEAGYDPFTDDIEDGHASKRRRKSYKDWNAWTYTARTPSPEKDDRNSEDFDAVSASPSRPAKFLHTPVSPAEQEQIIDTVSQPAQVDVVGPEEEKDDQQEADNEEHEQDPHSDSILELENESPESSLAQLVGGESEQDNNDSHLEIESDRVSSPNPHASSDEDIEHDDHEEMLPAQELSHVNFTDDVAADESEEEGIKDESEELIPIMESEIVSFHDEDDAMENAGETNVSMEEEENRDEHDELIPTIDAEVVSLHDEDDAVAESADDVQSADDVVEIADDIQSADDVVESEDETNVSIEEVNAIRVEVEAPLDSDQSQSVIAQEQLIQDWTGNFENPLILDDEESSVAMAPPTLPMLQTSFSNTATPSMLTPIGIEPKSPNLKPLDSSTLPMPSPFPGEQDGNITSYLEHTDLPQSNIEAQAEQAHSPKDHDDVDSTFYSSVSSSKTPAFHESAFTDVRFTFGFDGAALSSMLPTTEPVDSEGKQDDRELLEDTSKVAQEGGMEEDEASDAPVLDDISYIDVEDMAVDSVDTSVESPSAKQDIELADAPQSPVLSQVDLLEHTQPGTEHGMEDLEDSGAMEVTPKSDEAAHIDEVQEDSPGRADAETQQTQTEIEEDRSVPVTEIVDLGSGSSDESDSELSEESSDTPRAEIVEDQHQSDIPGLDQVDQDPMDLSTRNQLDLEKVESRDSHPDIKIESVEDDGPLHLIQQEVQSQKPREGDSAEPDEDSSQEILIEIPEEGSKMNENHVVAVPATAPARNTRSKTKLMPSPIKDETSTPRRTTRQSKGRRSIDSTVQTTHSPSTTRASFAASPTPVSPYNLRSQSKTHSPTIARGEQKPSSSQKPARKLSFVDTRVNEYPKTSGESLDTQDLDLPGFSYKPSQELGASQGKFSDVAYIKDSEDGSLHSESSLSTVENSDGPTMESQTYINNQQQEQHIVDLTGEGSATQDPGHITSSMVSSQFDTMASPTPKSFSRSTPSVTSGTPRRSQRLRKDVHDLPTDNEELPDVPTPKQTSHGVKDIFAAFGGEGKGKGKGKGSKASPSSASSFVEQPSVTHDKPQSIIIDSNKLVTPEATQHTSGLQPSFAATQEDTSMPMTPQPTQTTTENLPSFKTAEEEQETEDEIEEVVRSPNTKSPLRRVTIAGGLVPETEDEDALLPRRVTLAGGIVSRSASPTRDSLSDTETTLVAKPERPSIGLSTPIAYYTPLKDLPYFLNRSSQFHSAANPDILALVTRDSTSPKKADKGPKHSFTTLHVTDLSIYPASTTVQVFRPYAAALPVAQKGDVVLLRSFVVKSLNRQPALISGEESAWCVWKYGVLLWGKSRAPFAEVMAREEVKGPGVERGEGEWKEVERLRAWYLGSVEGELQEREGSAVVTRSQERAAADEDESQEG